MSDFVSFQCSPNLSIRPSREGKGLIGQKTKVHITWVTSEVKRPAEINLDPMKFLLDKWSCQLFIVFGIVFKGNAENLVENILAWIESENFRELTANWWSREWASCWSILNLVVQSREFEFRFQMFLVSSSIALIYKYMVFWTAEKI